MSRHLPSALRGNRRPWVDVPSASSRGQGVPPGPRGAPPLPQRSSSEDFIRKHRF